MLHPRILSLCLCLALTSCTVFKSSPTWKLVVNSRRSFIHEADPSAAYAQHLHRELQARGIEHRIVSYEFRYLTRLREEAIEARTAVIYRDDTNPTHPWWLAEERLPFPRWLPNGPVERQLSFATGHPAHVLSLRDIPGPSAPALRTSASRHSASFRETHRAAIRPLEADRSADVQASWAEAFEARHGTAYNPRSSLDRRKMAAMLQTR